VEKDLAYYAEASFTATKSFIGLVPKGSFTLAKFVARAVAKMLRQRKWLHLVMFVQGILKGGRITVLFTSCLTGLESAV
jgi:hypothetical protein